MEKITLYTSYFSCPKIKQRDIPEGYELISIAQGTPPWFDSINKLDCAKPRWELINGIRGGTLSESDFMTLYLSELMKKNTEIQQHLNEIKNGKRFIYLCHERSDAFCHRHIWAKVLIKLGCEVKEL